MFLRYKCSMRLSVGLSSRLTSIFVNILEPCRPCCGKFPVRGWAPHNRFQEVERGVEVFVGQTLVCGS